MVKPWFTQFQKDMKSKYNITVTVNSYGHDEAAAMIRKAGWDFGVPNDIKKKN